MTTEAMNRYSVRTSQRRDVQLNDLDARAAALVERSRDYNYQEVLDIEQERAESRNAWAIRREMQRQDVAGLTVGNYVEDADQLADSLSYHEHGEEIAQILAGDADRLSERDGVLPMEWVDTDTVGRYDEFGEFVPTPYDERAIYTGRSFKRTVATGGELTHIEPELHNQRGADEFDTIEVQHYSPVEFKTEVQTEAYNLLQDRLRRDRARHGIEFAWTVRGDKVRETLETEEKKAERMIRRDARDAKRSDAHARNKAKKLARLAAKYANK